MEQKNFGHWITNILLSAIIVSLMITKVNARGARAIVLYTYDDSIQGTEMLSMEVNPTQFKEAMASSRYFSTAAEPLKFDNGYFTLLEGKSTSFKLKKLDDEITCKCEAKKIITTTTSTTRTTTTTTTKKPTTTTTKPPPTYLPPTTINPCPKGGSGKYCCLNGANNADCCENGGKGKFCCTNGANNKDCCENNGSGPFCCKNGATNPDCCDNGGKGKYCCTNGENNPGCKTTTPGPTYLPPTSTPTITTTPSLCPKGGKGPYCCKNGANNVDCCENNGSGPFCCKNGANNKDCCENGGKGKYCCTNGQNNPGCQGTTTTLRTTRPITTTKFRGPSYLPIDKVLTTRIPEGDRTYTWGTPPTWTYAYKFTPGLGSWTPNTRTYTLGSTTTTPKYAKLDYENSLNYKF